MEKEFKQVITCDNYENVDGFRAYNSDIEKIELGVKKNIDNKKLEIITKLLKSEGSFEEIPVNRVLDMAILICEASLYFREAYKMSKLYDEKNILINRVALQGDAMNIKISEDNEDLDKDIFALSDELSRQGELIGERFRVLSSVLEEMGY